MYFIIINIILLVSFVFFLLLGIKIKVWAYIPINTIGICVAAITIILDRFDQLDKIMILVMFGIVVIILVVDLLVTNRDLREIEEDGPKDIIYLTNSMVFEHFKVIADERLMKAELDRYPEIPLNDRLQALEVWKQANRSYRHKQFQEALEKYELSYNWVNTSIASLNQSGVLLMMKKNDTAIPLIEQALKIDNKLYEAYLNYGVALLNMKQPDDALSKFEQATNINPDNFEAWFCCGNIYLKLKEYKAAIECYKKSIRNKNDFFESWYNKGLALKNIGEDDQALKCFEQVIKINPRHYQAFYRKANILSEIDFNEDAIADYNRAVKINPNYVDAWNNRGIVYRKIGQLKKAIKSYNRAIHINPKYYEAWINRGLAYDSLNNYKQALVSYQRFIELAPAEKDKYLKITKKRIAEIQEHLNMKNKRKNKQLPEPAKKPIEIRLANENNT